MASAFDVAEYLLSKADIEEGDGMTHLKLQKLLYYCQGFALAILKRELFEEKIEAWPHGPVVPDVYYKYSYFKNQVIEDYETSGIQNLTDDEKELIDAVYEVYGGNSASKLRNLSHSESPWQDAENKIDTTITIEALKVFFPSLLRE